MNTSPQGIVGVFDRAADTYDAVGVEWFGPVARGLVAQLSPASGERALDIGCGRGAALWPLAEGVGPGGRAVGIDLSPRMVAATAADARHLSQVEVRVGDASAPAEPSASFDLISSSLVLFFLRDPAAALAAWLDLLVPGGRLGVSTFGGRDRRWSSLDGLFTEYLPQGMLDARTSGATGPFASDLGMERLLSAAGLTDVRTESSFVDAVFVDPEQWLRFSWSHGQRAMWESVPAERQDDVKRSAFALLEDFRDPDGRIVFRQDVRYTLGHKA